jgi:hypothetical protein
MRALLPLLDGTRDREALVAALAAIAPSVRDARRALRRVPRALREARRPRRMSATALHAGLKAAYEDVAYVGRPNHHSHPDRLAAIATLFGMTPADPAPRAGARGRLRRRGEPAADGGALSGRALRRVRLLGAP